MVCVLSLRHVSKPCGNIGNSSVNNVNKEFVIAHDIESKSHGFMVMSFIDKK